MGAAVGAGAVGLALLSAVVLQRRDVKGLRERRQRQRAGPGAPPPCRGARAVAGDATVIVIAGADKAP